MSFVFLPFLAWVAFTSSTVFADFVIHGWENQNEEKAVFSFQLTEIYYHSDSNFNRSGIQSSIPGLYSYDRFQSDLTLRYGFSQFFSSFARLSWGYIHLDSETQSGTRFGLMDQTAGMTYRVYGPSKTHLLTNETPSIDLQTQIDIPAYRRQTSLTEGTPDLGDGSLDWTGGLFLTLPITRTPSAQISSIFGGGYTLRTLNYSGAFPYSVHLQYIPRSEGFFADIALLGTFSSQTDTVLNRFTQSSGGSFMTDAVNPSLLQFKGTLGYQVSQSTEFWLSAMQSLWGQQSPNGLSLLLGFQTQLGHKHSKNPTQLTPKTYGLSNQGFLTYSLDAQIKKTNERLNLVKIDKGRQDGVEVGQIFDIFSSKENRSPEEAIARAKVSSIKLNEAVLDITEFYQEIWVETGFLAKRLIP